MESDEQPQLLIEQASEICAAADRLIRLLVRIPPKDVSTKVKSARSSVQKTKLFPAAKSVHFGRVKGQFAAARIFIAKCVRDLPAIVAKTKKRPTPAELARINIEATRTALGC